VAAKHRGNGGWWLCFDAKILETVVKEERINNK